MQLNTEIEDVSDDVIICWYGLNSQSQACFIQGDFMISEKVRNKFVCIFLTAKVSSSTNYHINLFACLDF